MSVLKFISCYLRNERPEDSSSYKVYDKSRRETQFSPFAVVAFKCTSTADGLNIFHRSSRNISDYKEGQATPREIQYISLKTLSTVEDDIMQYGARDKLTLKINVRSRFVSSSSRAVEVAPVSLVLYYAAYDILPSDTLNFGHRERGKNGEKGGGESLFSPETCSDANVREMQPTRFANSGRSFGSRFLGASRAKPSIPLVNTSGASHWDRRSNGFRHWSRCTP